MGVCRFFCHRLFEALIVILLILFIPQLPPYTSISEPFSISPIKPFEGKLSLNEKLNDVEIWKKGQVSGPETFAEYKGQVYVTMNGGEIWKFSGNDLSFVTRTGKECKGPHEERICGRPLGLQIDKNGMLYVADAYYGIYKINLEADNQKTLLVSLDREIGGKKPKLPNSIALASNGDFYWSDSTTEFYLEDGMFDLFADPTGRLIHFDAKTGKNTVLMDKLHFANGVALSEDEEFVIVAETARNRIHRYYLKGPKRGTRDIFADGLPGMPDNFKADGKGGFFVPLVIAVDADHPSPHQVVGSFPLLRKLIARVFGLVQLGFELINKVYPCEFAQKGMHFVGHFHSSGSFFFPKRTTLLHLDRNGNIVDSLHALNQRLACICDVQIFEDTLYLGSPFNDYIARVPLSKIGWQHLSPEKKKCKVPVGQTAKTQPPSSTTPPTTTPPPTTTTPPPTTTTPPPTTTRPPTTAPPTPQTPSTPQQQTPPPSPKPQATAPPPKQQTTPPPPKQQTPPAPPKQQTPPVPPKQQTTPPAPPKQQTTPPPPPKQQTPSPSKQQTPPPPPKQQTTPPPPPKQQTPPPSPKQQTAPPPPQQTPPPPKQQTTNAPPTQTTVPPPKQTPPSPKQQTTTPPPKQTPPSPKPQQQTTSPSPKQENPAPKQAQPNQVPPPAQKPATQAPPSKQAPPLGA